MRDFYSFSMLGKYGRLGNQMFQVSTMLCLSSRKNYDLFLPNNESATVRKYFNIPCLDLNDQVIPRVKYRWEESQFKHQNLDGIPSSTDVVGYLQSWKYITDEKLIRKSFSYDADLKLEAKKSLPKGSIVSLHIRRGDYLKYPDVHPIPSKNYYLDALSVVKEKDPTVTPVIFTDDLMWSKENFPDYQVFSNSEIKDMCMMSLCNHNIIANSSFSWWAAWLGTPENRIVIAPKLWFGPKGPQDTQDLIPEHWKRI